MRKCTYGFPFVCLLHFFVDLHDLMNCAANHKITEYRRRRRRIRDVGVRSWIGWQWQFVASSTCSVLWSSEMRTMQRPFKNLMQMSPRCSMSCHPDRVPGLPNNTPGTGSPWSLKLALILRHLASSSKYSTMKNGWRVPYNIQSLINR